MNVFLMVVIIVLIGSLGSLSAFITTIPLPMVLAIAAMVVLGGILREFVKTRKDINSVTRKNLEELRQHIAQIEADIADIKEQIADFIIKNV